MSENFFKEVILQNISNSLKDKLTPTQIHKYNGRFWFEKDYYGKISPDIFSILSVGHCDDDSICEIFNTALDDLNIEITIKEICDRYGELEYHSDSAFFVCEVKAYDQTYKGGFVMGYDGNNYCTGLLEEVTETITYYKQIED